MPQGISLTEGDLWIAGIAITIGVGIFIKFFELVIFKVFGIKAGPTAEEIGEAISRAFTTAMASKTDEPGGSGVCQVCRAFLLERIEASDKRHEAADEKMETIRTENREDHGKIFDALERLQGQTKKHASALSRR